MKGGRATVKMYGCIFVCFTSRAIHVEDVGSLETDAFIQALQRFICIWGAAKEIWSDNGTNFAGVERDDASHPTIRPRDDPKVSKQERSRVALPALQEVALPAAYC